MQRYRDKTQKCPECPRQISLLVSCGSCGCQLGIALFGVGVEEFGDLLSDVIQLVLAQLRIDGESKRLAGRRLRLRKIGALASEVAEALLLMQTNRIINF